MKTIQEIKQLSIVDYLQQAGHEPKQIKGNSYWYSSPLRQERTPSFKVNTERNQWYDFATGEHGDIIDLVCALHRCSTAEALQRLRREIGLPLNDFSFGGTKISAQQGLEILSVQPISSSQLQRYGSECGISPSQLEKYCSEVRYRSGERSYYALGFPNDAGGWELRNPYFKGCIAPKAISMLGTGAKSVQVFEGFMDFLSWRTLHPNEPSDSLVLNSLALLPRALPQLQAYPCVESFLDNDDAGRKALQHLREAGIEVKDMSRLYAPHKTSTSGSVRRTSRKSRLRRLTSEGFADSAKASNSNRVFIG